MFLLGLAVAVVYVPGYLGATIPPQWGLLSIILPLALWKEAAITPFHWAFGGALGYAFLSALWAPNGYDAVWELWQLSIAGAAFCLGATLTSLRPIYAGLAVGLGLSSALAVAQALGWQPVLHDRLAPGLYWSSMIHGEVLALVLTALASEAMWWGMPALVPGLVLSGSRGAWLAACLGIWLTQYPWRLLGIICGLAVALWIALAPTESEQARLAIWLVALANLSPSGHGAGSFISLYLPGTVLIHPEFVHNDFLQTIFEYGLGSIPLLAGLAVLYGCSARREWPVLVCFLFMAVFSFPLHVPVLVFVGSLAAGRIARDWSLLRDCLFRGRHALVPWMAHRESGLDRRGREAVPVQLRTQT